MQYNYKALFLIFSLFLISHAIAQGLPAIEWQKSLGGTGYELGNTVKQTTDGGYIMAGSSSSADGDLTGNTASDGLWIVKTNNTGTISWQILLNGMYGQTAIGINQTTDGGYILTGYKEMAASATHTLNDVLVIKLDASGAVQWQHTYGGSANDRGNEIIQTADGGYVVAGFAQSDNAGGDVTGHHGSGDCWIIKLDSQGTLIWQKTLGGSSYDEAWSIQQTTDGSYIVGGYTSSANGDVTNFHGVIDSWIIKLDTSGNIIWQKTFGGSFDDRTCSIKQTTDGGYIAAGFTNSDDGDVSGYHGTPGDPFSFDYWVVKLDAGGTLTWQKTLGGTNSDTGYSVCQTTDGGYAVAGLTGSNNGDVTGFKGGLYDYWVVKLDTDGNLAWQKTMGGTGDDYGFAIDNTSDNGLVVLGYAYSTNGDVTGNHSTACDFWMVKLEGYEIAGTAATTLTNVSLYPNPAVNNTVTLSGIPAGSSIKITDITGKIIYTAHLANQELTINTASFSSGIYMVTINNSKAATTKKLVVSK